MNNVQAEIKMRSWGDVARDVARIVPDADTAKLKVLVQQQKAPAHQIFKVVLEFCKAYYDITKMPDIYTSIVTPQDLPTFSRTIGQTSQAMSRGLAELFLRLGEPPQG